MSTTTDKPNQIHHGHNLKRFREMLSWKQEALALALGEDWNQKKVSLLEQKEIIEEDILQQVAKVLGVPVEAIKNFDEEKAIYNIQNNYEGSNSGATNVGPANYMNYQCTFNPIEKIVELYDEKVALLERLLQAEKEKNELLKNSK
ncbi:helix-turn-helix transcriptional regulator [Mucilaginibacter sabulilitoris]|uniref:Helix-turn-helix transcriptional regulator n=1 Tax=Mucilaginibacter sabulilitoris TaxID=1173583 RepID=A0ABZ0TFA6_9SPHI|nr:helix-turn-helix transcriptional regulator [Mucilaginibacter sabulilitoris]WPU91859.1 helix-turn-helix transcriptional regulator [Mucilaginibacter sabulilitoris]